MGFRNPFRFSIDPANGWVYLADYGPDRNPPTTNRGPEGLVELNVIKQAGNYGWPFCHGDNQPYAPFNPDTGVVGSKFNCSAPVNNSPNNTGLTSLKPVVAPNIWYGYGTSPTFPELGSGGSAPMGGPVYRYDASNPSATKFPPYYDGVHFFYEWSRNYIKEVHFDSSSAVTRTNPFLPSTRFNKPMDMEFGKDGSLYLLEWGTNFGGGNSDSGLYRIDYIQGGRSPIAKATGTPTSGSAPLTVQFSSAGTADPDPGNTLSYQWTFGDGTTSTAANPSKVYTANGNYTAQLKVTDNTGKTGFANVQITVGNSAPVVTITTPPNGGMLTFGDKVPYQITVTDPDGGTVDCSKVFLNPALGHDDHAHETTEYPGCSGTISTDLLGGHPDGANLFYVLNARYTDSGGAGGAAPLTGTAQAILQPKHKQSEYFTSQSGIRVVDQAAAESTKRVGDISNNDWISFSPMSLSGISTVSYRLSSPSGGGTIELRVRLTDRNAARHHVGARHRWLGQLPVHDTGERRRQQWDADALHGVQGQQQQLVRSGLAHLRRERRRDAHQRWRRRSGGQDLHGHRAAQRQADGRQRCLHRRRRPDHPVGVHRWQQPEVAGRRRGQRCGLPEGGAQRQVRRGDRQLHHGGRLPPAGHLQQRQPAEVHRHRDGNLRRVHGAQCAERALRGRQRRIHRRRRPAVAVDLPQRRQPAVAVHRSVIPPLSR